MRLALLADIHSNLEALRSCLAHAAHQNIDRTVVLGDIVGYNADPLACIDVVADLAANGGIVLRGNHDTACLGGLMESMNFLAREAIYWTRSQLGQAQFDFLAQLPLTYVVDGCLFSHGSPAQPEMWRYITGAREAGRALTDTSEPRIFVGHVHRSVLFFNGGNEEPRHFLPGDGVTIPLSSLRRWVCVIGAVGQSRDNLSAASYGILDTDRSCLTIYRVPYNCHLAARKIRNAGLPERLAQRLEKYNC